METIGRGLKLQPQSAQVSEGFIYIFIFYRCLVGFAVLNVATGTRNKATLEAQL